MLIEGVTIYLTNHMIRHKNTFSRDRVFAIFLLLSVCCFATTDTGRASAINTHAALTKIHLPLKGESWLSLSVAEPQNRIPASASFQWQRERSLPKSNCLSHPITTSLKSCFRTRPLSIFKLNPVSKLCRNWSIGNQANTNRSNAGDLSTAFSPHYTPKNSGPPEKVGCSNTGSNQK
jgi:hypothetical protein